VLSSPASKKRQGTKSREVWHRLGSGRYGDLIRPPTLVVNVTQGGWDLRMDVQTMPRAHDGHLSPGLECANGHSDFVLRPTPTKSGVRRSVGCQGQTGHRRGTIKSTQM
jgi:hypothetical protein